MRPYLSILSSNYPFQLWGKPYIFVFFILRSTRFLLEIDGRVLSISTFAGLVVGSVSYKHNKEINMQMNENG